MMPRARPGGRLSADLSSLVAVFLACWIAFAVQAASLPPDVAEAQSRAQGLAAEGRFEEAIPHAERALELGLEALGANSPESAALTGALAKLYELQGRYREAEPLYKRALAVTNRTLGGTHQAAATSLGKLGNLYRLQGRYAEAEALLKRALKIAVKALGPAHLEVARLANDAALLYLAVGRYDVAEKLYLRTLAIVSRERGPEHLDVAMAMNNAANFYYRRGRYAEAEGLHRKALGIKEKALAPDHPSVAVSLNNLAEIYRSQGRYARSQAFFARALAITERRLGPDHPAVAEGLSNLALLLSEMEELDEAETLLKRAVAISETSLGPRHPRTAKLINNLAVVYIRQQRYEEAGPLQMRSLAINRKVFGPDNIKVAVSLHNAAEIHRRQGQLAEAEQLHLQALEIRQRALGADHPEIAHNLLRLAQTLAASDQVGAALDRIREATAIQRRRILRPQRQQRTGRLSEQARALPTFLTHLDLLARRLEGSSKSGAPQSQALVSEALEVAQLAKASSVSQTVAQVAARFATGGGQLARTVRARQDAGRRLDDLDGELLEALSRRSEARDADYEERLRTEILVLRRKLERLDAELAKRFPRYAELVSARPVELASLQAVLAPDEAVLVYAVGEEATYILALRSDRAELHRAAIGRWDLDDEIAELRAGLDATAVERLDDIPPFDVMAAHYLYKTLVAPAETLLAGARHVIVVPDGALQSLPFGVLVSEFRLGISKFDVAGSGSPQVLHDFLAYRSVPWLARKYNLTAVPSVSSLAALRRFARASSASAPFIAFADPLLEGAAGGARGAPSGELFQRGVGVDLDALRRMARLPDTADEVRALARVLRAGDENLFLGDAATEARVRTTDLSAYRILAFATHGLMAGDFGRLAEPALVLTPPASASEQDDGLLTASEIAQLELDADWVLLSACNTAAADGTPGAEGFSGLAKAFFYAGSRALLVSHWSVNSDAATKLTTTMFAEAAKDPELGRTEALHRAMQVVMGDDEKPFYAHPMFWAPFVVVGEGGAASAGTRPASRPD